MTPARSIAASRPLREDHLGASTFVEKGWHQIAHEDFAVAEDTLKTALALAPSDCRTRTLLGWAIMRQGRLDEALKILDHVLGHDAMNALARTSLGYVCMRLGLMREAHEHLSRAEAQTRDPKAALYACFFLGLLYSQQRDLVEAERYFLRTLSLAPNFIEAYYELGRAFRAAGETNEAENVWRAGNAANRFSPWGKRCATAIKLVGEGQEPPSFS
ncbi:MAG TPA: tetratricopeptide repeat protein [Gemmatimonadaceae bacterium]|nr:tetratricopeptide repeat protein [Gemmatimonadaceae bacterium]